MTRSEQREITHLAKVFEQAPPIQLDTTAEIAFAVLGNIQLALRHPGNRGPSSKLAEAFGRGLQNALAAIDPDLGRVCERGWHSCFDVPRERSHG